LVDRVVRKIQEQILSERLAVGTKLPPQREFAEHLGVSRTVFREAVRVLSAKGLVETCHGVMPAHIEMLDCIVMRDAKRARQAMRAHLLAALDVQKKAISSASDRQMAETKPEQPADAGRVDVAVGT
jgi:DNA-binding FadR family transcriptional regulator